MNIQLTDTFQRTYYVLSFGFACTWLGPEADFTGNSSMVYPTLGATATFWNKSSVVTKK
jgi:hypothetical protein